MSKFGKILELYYPCERVNGKSKGCVLQADFAGGLVAHWVPSVVYVELESVEAAKECMEALQGKCDRGLGRVCVGIGLTMDCACLRVPAPLPLSFSPHTPLHPQRGSQQGNDDRPHACAAR